MKELSEIWQIPISSANTLYPVDKPVIQVPQVQFPQIPAIKKLLYLLVAECLITLLLTNKYNIFLQNEHADIHIGRVTLERRGKPVGYRLLRL